MGTGDMGMGTTSTPSAPSVKSPDLSLPSVKMPDSSAPFIPSAKGTDVNPAGQLGTHADETWKTPEGSATPHMKPSAGPTDSGDYDVGGGKRDKADIGSKNSGTPSGQVGSLASEQPQPPTSMGSVKTKAGKMCTSCTAYPDGDQMRSISLFMTCVR